MLFTGGVATATQIQIFDTNSDNVDFTSYYEMLDSRNLSGTLTVTEFNDTDSYVIYEFEADGVSFTGNVLTITPTSVYASPLVSNTNAPVGDVCISFDLFRGVKTLNETGITSSNSTFYSVTQSEYDGMVIDYIVRKTDGTTGTRTGTIMAAWDGTTSTVQFTDTSTTDAGGTTSGLVFRVEANGTNASLGFTVSSGTYTVTITVRPIGTYS
jgi:hypothetical protein